jgi:hypothetical protein
MEANFANLELYARSVYGFPPDWSAWLYQSIRPDDDWSRNGNLDDLFQVTGAVCPLYTRGPKKGKPNYKKLDPATKKTVTFTKRAFIEWCAKAA